MGLAAEARGVQASAAAQPEAPGPRAG